MPTPHEQDELRTTHHAPRITVVGLGPGAWEQVTVTQGEVIISRPLIITPDNAPPEFENFFDNAEEAQLAEFLMSRTASFSHLKLGNRRGSKRIVSDSEEEAVAKLNRQLDTDEEDHVAILTAPMSLAGLAIFTAEASCPFNCPTTRSRMG